MNSRISNLKEEMLKEERYLSIEQAKIITKIYKENENDSTILKRAKALKASLEEMEIDVKEDELVVGNRTKQVRAGVVFPEGGMSWLNDEIEDLAIRPQDKFNVRKEDIKVFREEIYPYWEGKTLEDRIDSQYGEFLREIKLVDKINQTDHAQGHIIPNVERWLQLGPQGLKKIALEKLEDSKDFSKEFYEAVVIIMDGAINFIKRYRDLVLEIKKDANLENQESLEGVYEVLHNLSEGPAETFKEAIQSLWFLFVILQMESNASSFSPGRMDQYLLPYYIKDKEMCLINDEKALELIEALFLKFNQIVYMRSAGSAKYFAGFPIGFNIALGGVNEDGEDTTNELSYLFLDAQFDLGLPQPNLSVRLHSNSPEEFIYRAVEVVAKGSGMPQFFNDKAIINTSIESLGIEKHDAYNYGIVGCVELSTQGNSLGWSDAAMFNLNKALEYTLTGGIDLITKEKKGPNFGNLTTFKTYEDLEDAYEKMLDYYIEKMVRACEYVEKTHIEVMPSPFLSAVVDDCLDKGVDVTAGGAKYNLSGIQMIQVANLADSLIALKEVVFEDNLVSKKDMLNALYNNFENEEILRQRLLNKVPKYGNDIDKVDSLGNKWANKFREKLSVYTNYRGGKYHTGMYTVSAHVPMGQTVGATADGRLSQEPLADGGLSPVYGRDLVGPTAVLKSVSKLDNNLTTNGGLLNMKFLPSFFETENGKKKFVQFLRAFVDLEIPHIQFNVVNELDLIKAKENPEEYKSLTVRVAGYTAYFIELADDLQDEIIARTTYTGM